MKIGFLIEFHRSTLFMNAKYNGTTVRLGNDKKQFPMTTEILNIIKGAVDLDFVIIAQYDEGTATEVRDVKIYEPRNIKESIEKQRIKVFDSVTYEKNNAEVKLLVKKDDSREETGTL